MSDYPGLRVEAGDRPDVVVVTLDRPERLNALTFDMFDAIRTLCEDLERDRSTRVVILTGAGRAFCAGLDLDAAGSLCDMSRADFLQGQRVWSEASLALTRLSCPVIAAVNGPAAGAGFSLALAADIRVVGAGARFNAAFIRVGLTGGDMGSSWLLPRLVGPGLANELLFTGRFVEADEAVRIGLVNRVVAADELLPTCHALAADICANSPLGVRLTKTAVQANLGAATLWHAMELENRNQSLAASTDDMREAVVAFRARRDPTYVDH